MSSRSRLLIVASCLAILVGSCLTSVLAQVPGIGGARRGRGGGGSDRQQQQQQQQMQQQLLSMPALQTSGTVEAVMPGWIKVSTAANQSWILQILPTARCQVTGKAKPDFLSPGYFIRFSGEVSKKGAVEQKVSKVTVFTPSKDRQPGAEPDSGLGTSFGPRPGEEARKPEGKAAFGAGADGFGKKAGGAGGMGKSAGGEIYDVRGQIAQVSNGRLTVQVPTTAIRSSIRVEVAEDADIDVELDDPMCYTLARKGDKVRIQGRQGMGNRGFAEELDIILSEPLGTPSRDAKKYAGKGVKGKRGAEPDESADSKDGKKDGKAEKKDDDSAAKPKKSGKSEDGDASDEAPKKKSKAADSGTEKPAKKKKKPAKSDDDA